MHTFFKFSRKLFHNPYTVWIIAVIKNCFWPESSRIVFYTLVGKFTILKHLGHWGALLGWRYLKISEPQNGSK